MPTMDPRYNNAGIAYSMNNIMKAMVPSPSDDASIANTRYLNARAEGQILSNQAQRGLGQAVADLMNVNNQPMPSVPQAATPDAGMGPAPMPSTMPVDRNVALTNLATNYLQGGNAPAALGDVFLALLANNNGTDRGTVARALAGSGKPLGENQAVDIGHQQQIRQQNQDWAIQKELATPRAVNPGDGLASAMGYYIKPDPAVAAAAGGQGKDYMVKPDDMNAINSHIDQRFGILLDKNGGIAEGSNPDLSPATRQMLSNRAAQYMREGRMDFIKATEQAIADITGGQPLTVEGSSGAWNPFAGDSRQQTLSPDQMRGVAPLTATNPSTGERIISRDGGQTWSKM